MISWECRQVEYEAVAPVHIGFRTVGNVQETRYYIPARNFWGAAVALTARAVGVQYEEVARFVGNNLRFSYFYPCIRPGQPLIPRFDKAWRYATPEGGFELSPEEFKCHFVSSVSMTSISGETRSAMEGSLHHVEFLCQHSSWSPSERVRFSGFVFLRANAEIAGERVRWAGGGLELSRIMREVFVGGERRSGFGRLRLASATPLEDGCLWNLWQADLGSEDLAITALEKETPLVAHCRVAGVDARGRVEPVVGREWTSFGGGGGAGQLIRREGICWVPGSAVELGTRLKVTETGVFEA